MVFQLSKHKEFDPKDKTSCDDVYFIPKDDLLLQIDPEEDLEDLIKEGNEENSLICCQTQIFRLRFRDFQNQIFYAIVLGLNLLIFRHLSKFGAQAHVRLYFKHIFVVLLFLDFPGKLPLCRKSEQFWVISISGSGQFHMFMTCHKS